MKILTYKALIIGTGAAGFNTADTLFDLGVKDIAIVTEGINMGTSRNTGSDKQTYYKMSLSGDDLDSVTKMANTLFDGGCVDGDIALCEAANSLKGFYKLVSLGVKFPTNEYGEYVGYKTDHDPCKRGTSIGPYTSKKMTECLEASVKSKNIQIIDNTQIIKIVTKDNKVVGCIGLQADDNGYELVAIKANNVVVATGGPSSIYFDSVYPCSHTGSSGIMIDANVKLANMDHWQYGLASTDFRWNVSGTYMQVLPRFISIDKDNNVREFMLDYFKDPKEMVKNIFLKGYQWPFDVNKINGSSIVDLLVYNETVVKGNKVYLDFLKNPTGAEDISVLDDEVKEYLINSGATQNTPLERLLTMNSLAFDLYKTHNIDLSKEPLRIAVCSQHCNGGADVDANWETNISGLYCVGEAAGTFGISRPGGSALNSTQVGSLRAALAIASKKDEVINGDSFIAESVNDLQKLIDSLKASEGNLFNKKEMYEKRMSKSFAFIRNINEMKNELVNIDNDLANYFKDIRWNNPNSLKVIFKTYEILLTSKLVAESMIYGATNFGSRGSSYVINDNDFLAKNPIKENMGGRNKRIVADKNGVSLRDIRPLPDRETWFEKVWNKNK